MCKAVDFANRLQKCKQWPSFAWNSNAPFISRISCLNVFPARVGTTGTRMLYLVRKSWYVDSNVIRLTTEVSFQRPAPLIILECSLTCCPSACHCVQLLTYTSAIESLTWGILHKEYPQITHAFFCIVCIFKVSKDFQYILLDACSRAQVYVNRGTIQLDFSCTSSGRAQGDATISFSESLSFGVQKGWILHSRVWRGVLASLFEEISSVHL